MHHLFVGAKCALVRRKTGITTAGKPIVRFSAGTTCFGYCSCCRHTYSQRKAAIQTVLRGLHESFTLPASARGPSGFSLCTTCSLGLSARYILLVRRKTGITTAGKPIVRFSAGTTCFGYCSCCRHTYSQRKAAIKTVLRGLHESFKVPASARGPWGFSLRTTCWG